MKKIFATLALTWIATTASALENNAQPYGVFNPVVMFETAGGSADNAFYNYGNQGYDFVVAAIELPVFQAPRQLAVLER